METFYIDSTYFASLPSRPARSNKGTFGRVLAVGGSFAMSGAAYFCAKAAYRTGAGLVQIMSPKENRVIYQAQLPEALLALYDTDALDEGAIKNAVCRANSVAVGMGLGTDDTAKSILKWVLEAVSSPPVIDADALNILSVCPELWELVPRGSIITPHPAEMSRISGLTVDQVCADIAGTAANFAKEHSVICLLKDHNTAISDGERTAINTSGNSGLATGGSGDVLAGIIAGLLAQGCKAFDAAALGAYIHGLAGDIAARRLSEYSVMASDIIDSLPPIFSEIQSRKD